MDTGTYRDRDTWTRERNTWDMGTYRDRNTCTRGHIGIRTRGHKGIGTHGYGDIEG